MQAIKTMNETHTGARANCPVCGHALDRLEQALAQNDCNFQCRYCWTRIGHGNGNGKKAAAHNGSR